MTLQKPYKWYETKMWPLESWTTARELCDMLRDARHNVRSSLECLKKIGGVSRGVMSRTMGEVEDDILQWMSQFDDVTLVAHNGKSFDHHILKKWFPRIKQEVGEFKDSLDMLRKQQPGLSSYSLPILARPLRSVISRDMKAVGMRSLVQHRALYDVFALATVMKSLITARAFQPLRQLRRCASIARILDGFFGIAEHSVDSWEDVRGIGPITAECLRKRWSCPDEFRKENRA